MEKFHTRVRLRYTVPAIRHLHATFCLNLTAHFSYVSNYVESEGNQCIYENPMFAILSLICPYVEIIVNSCE